MLFFKSNNTSKKRLSGWVTVFTVVFLLFSVLLTPAVSSIAYSEHEHDYEVVCRNTGLSVCNCDDDSVQATYVPATYVSTGTYPEFFHYNSNVDDCLECTLLHKATGSFRFSCIAACSTIYADIMLSSQDLQCFDLVNVLFLTSVDLKVKMSI